MPDIFVDIEFTQRQIFLLSAHCLGVTDDNNRFQLHGRNLNVENFLNFINRCDERRGKTLLFCHGPDFGHIENHFNIDLRNHIPCINVITAFRTFTRFQNVPLGHLAQSLNLGEWRDPIPPGQVGALWRTQTHENRQTVLDYNWDDCVILGNAVNHLRRERVPRVTTEEFIAIRMQ